MSNRSSKNFMPILFSIIFLLGLLAGYIISNKSGNTNIFSKKKNSTLQEISNLIQSKYVDKLDIDSINKYAADEMLSHLDPHSTYISPSDLQSVNNQMEGQFTGIGIMYDIIDDTLNVLRVLKNGPAEKAEIQVGDKFIKANDSIALFGKSLSSDVIKSNLRGAKGSTINIKLIRDKKLVNVDLVRASIPIPSIDAAYLIGNKTGYIRLNIFAERTYEEFMQSLEKLQKNKIDKLILDLRGNGGGYMHAATAIADEFLDNDKLIVYTQGNKSEKTEFRCKKEGLFEKGKLVVLLDELSASASEVLAGALQDWDRATIIGRRSFGKGLVQQQFNLSDGGALRLTVARYYTPLGRNIQRPYSNGKKNYQLDFLERFPNATGHSNNEKGKAYKTPKGNIVYGGGGITPNVEIGFDTTMFALIDKLTKHNSFEKFVYKYFISNKNLKTQYKTVDEFTKYFALTDNDWNAFNTITKTDNVINTSFSKVEKSNLELKIKAVLARLYFNDEAFYKINNSTDTVVIKAINTLNSN